MRLAGTAIICILAAFGAAFLVARSVNHQTPARAATPPPKTTRVADTMSSVAPKHKVDVELVSQFAPIAGSKLKPRPKPHRKHKKVKPAVSVTPASDPVTTTPTYTNTTPTYTSPPPSYTPAPSPAPTHKKKSGSSGGSGTTTIGG